MDATVVDAILILDEQIFRAGKLAALCKRVRPSALVARIVPGEYIVEFIDDGSRQGERTAIPSSARAILIHYRNEVDADKLPVSDLKIWFGGDGAENPDEQLAIHRRLPTANSVVEQIKEREIRELMDWIWALDRKTLPLPALLEPPKGLDHIRTLAILCQGYLLSYLASTFEAVEPHVLELASDIVFQYRRLLDRGFNRGSASSNWSNGDVQKSSWWLTPFVGGKQLSLPTLENEWGSPLPSAVRNFVNLLHSTVKISDPAFVATVYHHLVDRLTL